MALSETAAREIAKALRKHVGMKALEQVVTELVEIPGDKDFRDSIENLVHALRTVSDRQSLVSPVGGYRTRYGIVKTERVPSTAR